MNNPHGSYFWHEVFDEFERGIMASPYRRLLTAALRATDGNPVLAVIAQRHGLTDTQQIGTTPSSGVALDTQVTAFLCHSSGDKERVRDLYHKLQVDNIRCWFDEEDLLPGQGWEYEINKAIKNCRFVLACLSHASVGKRGFVQKELKRALDVADEQPEGSVFLIPVRLEECAVPDRLSHLHWVDLFENRGYERLLRVLRSVAR